MGSWAIGRKLAELPVMSPRITLLAVALSICLPLQAATEVIQLNNRMGEEVLPVAESVLGGRAVSRHMATS